MGALQELVLAHLDRNGGSLVDGVNVFELLAVALNSKAGLVRDACGALRSRDLVQFSLTRISLTKAGKQKSAASGSDGPPGRTSREGMTPPHQPAPAPVQSVNGDLRSRIRAFIKAAGGTFRAPDGKFCNEVLSDELGVDRQRISDALNKMTQRGHISRVATRGVGGGTREITLLREPTGGRPNGSVSKLQRRDPLGEDQNGQDAAVRREAEQGNDPQPGASTRALGPVGDGRSVREGDRRLRSAPHDVPSGRELEEELSVLRDLSVVFCSLEPDQRRRALGYLAGFIDASVLIGRSRQEPEGAHA